MNIRELMKKNVIAVVAIAIGISFSAFKAVERSLEETYYWFEYDEDGTNLIPQSSAPSPLATSPFTCEGGDQNCAQAFTSYTMVSPTNYVPDEEARDENNDPIIEKKDLD